MRMLNAYYSIMMQLYKDLPYCPKYVLLFLCAAYIVCIADDPHQLLAMLHS